MTLSWKIPAGAAGGAFLLSFLVGLLGRVGFGIAILRGMLWAVIFGALAFGVDYLLRRFLSELFTDQENGAVEEERSVDITLDEENPLAGETQASAEESNSAVEDALGENSEEIAELEQVDEQGETSGSPESKSDDSVEDEVVSGGELPSLEAVETAFVTSGVEERDDQPQSVSIDALGMDEDPATVARAVRTFMNKDQEG